jgi:uncharacterized protein
MSLNFKIAALALIALALLVFAALWAFQRYGVYTFTAPPQTPADVGLGDVVEVVSFTSGDGQPGRAWVARAAEGRPWILSFHGNSASIGGSMAVLTPLIEAGYGVVMMQYRGTQGLPGQPSEMGFAADARALYDQLDALLGEEVPAGARVLHGYSLGAGVGSRLAASRPFAGVILQSAPYRTCLFFERRYRGAPLCRLMWRERYDIVEHIRGIEAPLLVVHGIADAAVPVSEAEANYAAAPNPWGLRILEGGHGDLAEHGLIEVIAEFAEALSAPPPR